MRNALVVLLVWPLLLGAAPSRVHTYTAGQEIRPDEVTENEDALFAYVQSGVDTYAPGSVTSTAVMDGTLTNIDIASGAAIAYAKLTLTGSIVNADVSASAAIAYSKLNLSSSVVTGDVTDNTLTASDLAATLTFADGDFINLGAMNVGGTSEGLILPQASSCASGTAEGQICWDTDNELFVGTGAAALSMRPGLKVGTFTRDTTTATGTQAVTGVGFQPRVVLFFMAQAATVGEMSIGLDDDSSQVSVSDQHNITGSSWGNNTSESIADYESGTAFYQGVINTLDSDGFTISWTRTSTPSGTITIRYLAFQ